MPCLEFGKKKKFSSGFREGQKGSCVVGGELKARMAPCKSEKSGKEGDGENYDRLDYVRRTGIIVGSTASRSDATMLQYSNHLTICFTRGETVSAGSICTAGWHEDYRFLEYTLARGTHPSQLLWGLYLYIGGQRVGLCSRGAP